MTEDKQLYYCVRWPESQIYEEVDGVISAFDGFSPIVFVPKELYEKS